ncbi:Uu.00g062020.m01.CDS01 [Anthostomella pinea]|uniref:Uu.00g062020.m01.CDS01 n=1 Tax=Anthostomella pinea TaxID=933095 RepID=A0AAI8YKG1_9PEZI|nr:Uu.00g062020.m01.CDS01 [Anthostomella pinea]
MFPDYTYEPGKGKNKDDEDEEGPKKANNPTKTTKKKAGVYAHLPLDQPIVMPPYDHDDILNKCVAEFHLFALEQENAAEQGDEQEVDMNVDMNDGWMQFEQALPEQDQVEWPQFEEDFNQLYPVEELMSPDELRALMDDLDIE